jgi:hypothetical protein
MSNFRLADLTAEPEIHCRRREEQRSKWRIPSAIENVAGDNEQVFPQRPGNDAPIKNEDSYEEEDERERIKQHGVSRSAE